MAVTEKKLHTSEQIAGRLVALVVGLVLIVLGVAAGVTMVLLPLGIPAGLVGLFLVIGALFPGSLGRRSGGGGGGDQ